MFDFLKRARETLTMSKRAAEVQLTADNVDQQDDVKEEVSTAPTLASLWGVHYLEINHPSLHFDYTGWRVSGCQ